ncbi:hypothetical protein KQI84_18980 [bacterium]|nr:hypothetical protein [bacterium]
MRQVEVIARSEAGALEKASAKLEETLENLEIIEEYEPDELDLEQLTKDEDGLPEEDRQGEPVLYVVRAGISRFIERTREVVTGMVNRFQPGSTCEVFVEEGSIIARIDAPEPSIFIGRGGGTLDSMQHVITRILTKSEDDFPQVFLDVGDYREKKLERLEDIAEQAARRALKTRRNVRLRPMPSQDRKFIHNYLKSRQGISTSSHGREPKRFIEIEVAGGSRDSRGGRGRGGRSGGGRDGGRGGDRRRGGGDSGNNQQRREQPAPPSEMRQPAPPSNYEDVAIEERSSRLPAYKEAPVDKTAFDPDRPLVDEIE